MPRLRPALRSSARSWVRVSAAAAAGVGGGGQDDPGLGPGDAAAGVGEGGQEAGVVLAQVGAQLVVRAGARPDGVLLGAGQHRDGLGELGVGGQRPVRVGVGAQDVRQHDRVAVVGFAARDRVPVPVAGHGHRVDRVDLPAGGAQAGGQQPARGLDRHRDRVIGAVAVLGEQFQQRGQPGRVVADAAAGQQLAVPASTRAMSWWSSAQSIPQNTSISPHLLARLMHAAVLARPRGSRTLPNGRARRHRHPISRS